MNQKPLVTYHGDKRLFLSLNQGLQHNLPQESVEWLRSYGRAPKNVFVDANFVPFNDNLLPDDSNKSLIKHAYFHTYWTECYDFDAYKSTVREDISNWITKLKARNINDWLIISVENVEGRKGNKAKILPRTTILDKIKNEFASKQNEKCIALLDPFKSDSRAAESWTSLLFRIRHLILEAYNKTLSKFEANMRSQRERRNEPGWNFCDYFLLQEELAFVYEILGLYEDALVQYDELDALFTQFVLNSAAGDSPDWLTSFCNACNSWSSLSLSPSDRALDGDIRNAILNHTVTLLDFRNYLFCHQCSILLMLNRPWEVAERALPFMHNSVEELSLLEISMPEGSVACWVFLTCMEVIQSCQRYNDSSHIEACSLYTADLWAYARNKLHELGVLCGLMPDLSESSEQLHLVVGLVSGMGSDPSESEVVVQSPKGKLKEALSSRTAFQKYYLEMSELAMGTYKHIGRIRSARLIGIDLAHFYMKLKEPIKASVFYSDALKTYTEENWPELALKTQLQLVAAYEQTGETCKYVKSYAQLATNQNQSSGLDKQQKHDYFQKMVEASQQIQPDKKLLVKTDDMFIIKNIQVSCREDRIIKGNQVNTTVDVTSLFPDQLENVTVQISLRYNKSFEEMTSEHNKLNKRDSWGLFPQQYKGVVDADRNTSVELFEKIEYEHDNNKVTSASILCKNSENVLSHSDSHHWLMKAREPVKEEVTLDMAVHNVLLQPGHNLVRMSIQAGDPGVYSLVQLSIIYSNIEFIQSSIYPACSFNVITEQASICLEPIKSSLISGVEQSIQLTLQSGSQCIQQGTIVSVNTSSGLLLKDDKKLANVPQLSIELPDMSTFESLSLPIAVFAPFRPLKECNAVEHRLSVSCPQLISQPININLSFNPPFIISFKSHSAYSRKFIQVLICGIIKDLFEFKDHKLLEEDYEDSCELLKPLNPLDKHLIVSCGQQISYMWELDSDQLKPNCETLHFLFSAKYKSVSDDHEAWKSLDYAFKLSEFKTLYVLRNRVEPSKSSEFCRAHSMSLMHIDIEKVDNNSNGNLSLMYEVIADQSMWTVCGKTSGVITIGHNQKHDVTLDVKPLIGGFLPLPTIRLSKYIPPDNSRLGTPTKDSGRSGSVDYGNSGAAKLKPFKPGQVYNASRATQVHVLPATSSTNVDINS